MLKEFESNSKVFDYIRFTLSNGNILARRLLNLPLETGHVYAYLPESLSVEAAANFEFGGVMKRNQTELKLTSFIKDYLGGADNRYAIFEHALARPNDAFLNRFKVKYFTQNADIYIYLNSQDRDSQNILLSIRRATTHLFTGVLTTVSSTSIQKGQEVALAVLHQIARNTDYILVGAYDGEGVLIWSNG